VKKIALKLTGFTGNTGVGTGGTIKSVGEFLKAKDKDMRRTICSGESKNTP